MDKKITIVPPKAVIANGVGYDPSDINAPGVTIFTLVVVGVILAVFFGVTLYFEKFSTELTHDRIEAAPNSDLQAIHAREETQLHSFKLLDKSKGVVQIPLDQAMKSLLAEVPAGKGYSNKDQTVKVEGAAAPGAPAAGAAKPAAAAAAAPAPAAPAAKK